MLNEKLAQYIFSSENENCVSQKSNCNKNFTVSIFDSNEQSDENKKGSTVENSIFEDKDTDLINCSAVGPYGDIGGTIIDTLDGESKDGKIGNIKQGITTGDCWVLSAINSLNSTQRGKELIKEALQYGENGTFVNFKGAGQIYISNAEVTRTKGSLQYSSGDDDMIIFELAIEKILDKIANNEIVFSDDMQSNEMPKSENIVETSLFNSSIGDGGNESFVMYLLSGKEVSKYGYTKEEFLDKFINSEKTFVDGEYINKDYALGAATSEFGIVDDINGNKVKLVGNHAYSVKYATTDTVTVVNPWDTSKEITLSRDVFLNSFTCVYPVDLSDSAKDADYLIYTTKEAVENADGTKTEYIKDSNTGDVLKEIDYHKNGKIQKETENYQNGLIKSVSLYDKNGKKINNDYYTYYDNGSVKSYSYSIYDKNGKQSSRSAYYYNENGMRSSSMVWKYDNGQTVSCTFKSYDEYGNYEYSNTTTYKDGKVIKTEKDTDGDGIYDTVE